MLFEIKPYNQLSGLSDQYYLDSQKVLYLYSVYNEEFLQKRVKYIISRQQTIFGEQFFSYPILWMKFIFTLIPIYKLYLPQSQKRKNQIYLLSSKLYMKLSYQRGYILQKLDQEKIINFKKLPIKNCKEKNTSTQTQLLRLVKRIQRKISLIMTNSINLFTSWSLQSIEINIHLSTNKQAFESQKLYQCESNQKFQNQVIKYYSNNEK
ncbi:unnamed protein product [Paramecium sonneborni]|uniref:Transmembrane protein n=1 Tax=Paramecium sonneborni TaxID=65129 RepID=A0A8S1QXK4_9CILI|nr:unnamed protein product [Paramecium sonneborni]